MSNLCHKNLFAVGPQSPNQMAPKPWVETVVLNEIYDTAHA